MSSGLVVVGGGRMGEALVGGLLAGAWGPAGDLCVVEARPERRAELVQRFPGVAVEPAPVAADGVVLAVKPGDIAATAAAVAAAGYRRALSIAAGVTLATLESALDAEAGRRPVVRAMPNTPALVGAGAAALSGGSFAGEDDLAWAEGVLGALGSVVRVPEHLLDAVTGLSGSGPAYVFLLAEAFIDAGVLVGLPAEVSTELAIQTLLGAARLLAETGEAPASLRAAVTSPGGTTAAGLRALEAAGVRSAVLEAVAAATERSRQLGQG
ncbi:MAG TPA: pyrroline-5-carboxylate reductase [Acidimicrobiales bacterium]|nr:pyrroline-5-carboxylate reductase [Acidimicrobiales bacterium]